MSPAIFSAPDAGFAAPGHGAGQRAHTRRSLVLLRAALQYAAALTDGPDTQAVMKAYMASPGVYERGLRRFE
ncbi:MAG: hypothetical protein ACREMA_03470 [Longimicrobiales bacterium]